MLCGHSFVLKLIYIHDENIFWQLFLSKQLHDKKGFYLTSQLIKILWP